MAANNSTYPVTLDIDYPTKLDRFTSFVRVLWSIPILILISLITSSGYETFMNHNDKTTTASGIGITAGLSAATALMIIFRQRYPRWWFDFALELNRFSTRVFAYVFLLTDTYPSTVDKQAVHLDITYPDAERDLNRWLPIVKWFLAIPHYIVLFFLYVAVAFVTIIAWFAILFTGRYPKGMFDYVVGVARWSTRVNAYAFLLTTDQYPPFSLS